VTQLSSHLPTHLFTYPHVNLTTIYLLMQAPTTYLPTYHSFTYPPTYLPTQPPTCWPTTYLPTHPPTHTWPTYLLIYLATHPHPTHPFIYLPTHPPTYFVNLPTYLPTFYFLSILIHLPPTYHPTTCYMCHSLVMIWNKHVK